MPYIALRAAKNFPFRTSNISHILMATEQILDEPQSFCFDVALDSSELVLRLLTRFAKPGHKLCDGDLPYGLWEMTNIFINKLDEHARTTGEENVTTINRGNALKVSPRLQSSQQSSKA